MIPGREAIVVRTYPIAIVIAAICGLIVCSSCSQPDQTETNPPPANARAQENRRGAHHTAWWKDPAIVTEMELTDEQAEQVGAIMTEAAADVATRTDVERQAATRFHRALSQEQPDPKLVDAMSAELEEVFCGRERIRIDRIRKMREILTYEQWEKLWKLAPAALQVGHVRIFRGPAVYVTDGTPIPSPSAPDSAAAEP